MINYNYLEPLVRGTCKSSRTSAHTPTTRHPPICSLILSYLKVTGDFSSNCCRDTTLSDFSQRFRIIIPPLSIRNCLLVSLPEQILYRAEARISLLEEDEDPSNFMRGCKALAQYNISWFVSLLLARFLWYEFENSMRVL